MLSHEASFPLALAQELFKPFLKWDLTVNDDLENRRKLPHGRHGRHALLEVFLACRVETSQLRELQPSSSIRARLVGLLFPLTAESIVADSEPFDSLKPLSTMAC